MERFNEKITFAQSHEIPWPRDPTSDLAHWGVHHDDPPPFNRLRGPVHPRGGVSGVIRVRGEEVAAWGEPDRADQTFSVAKTYLALLAGIAQARGLLEPSERVSEQVPGIGFDSAHNRANQAKQIIPRDWVQRMHIPCAVAPFYGWLTWLNRDGRLFADASRASWFMFGAGGHMTWIDPDNEAVVVARWLDGAHSAGFVRRVAQALRS
jgi:CubicO group peptidase (beta-lactamase class C family)